MYGEHKEIEDPVQCNDHLHSVNHYNETFHQRDGERTEEDRDALGAEFEVVAQHVCFGICHGGHDLTSGLPLGPERGFDGITMADRVLAFETKKRIQVWLRHEIIETLLRDDLTACARVPVLETTANL